ncbi:MAG: copper transporter [Armatimonadetes bacterium]|nr:copper transporter [Armatimonadota bacterium]
MMDLRYHVATLIAIFLGLGVGVMLGGSQFNAEKYEQMLRRLEQGQEELRQQYDAIQQESARDKRVLQQRETALRTLLPLALRQRLPSGARLAVIWCGDWQSRPFWSDLESAIRSAGGQVVSVTTVPDDLSPLPPEVRARAISRLGNRATSVGGKYEALRWFVRGMCDGDYGQRLAELGDAAGLALDGNYSDPVRRFLLLCSATTPERQQRAQAGDIPEIVIADAALELGARVVAAEAEGTEESLVRLLGARGLPTVDNVDTAAGQLSVVLCLAGQDGQFGSKPGVTAPIPPLSPSP